MFEGGWAEVYALRCFLGPADLAQPVSDPVPTGENLVQIPLPPVDELAIW
jgi:hypothetical protein